MGIKVKYDPVGSMGLAAFAVGAGQAQERRRKEAVALMEQERQRRAAFLLQANRQAFDAGEGAKNRAAAAAKDMIPIGPGPAGGTGVFPATPAPDGKGGTIYKGPPDSRTTPGRIGSAPPVPGAPFDPMTGGPMVPGGASAMEIPIAPASSDPSTASTGLPYAPAAPAAPPSRFRAPGSSYEPGQEGIPLGATAIPDWMKNDIDENRARYWSEGQKWKNDLKGMATERLPDGIAINPKAKKEWDKWQSVLSGVVMDRKFEPDRAETQATAQEAIDNLNRLKQENPQPDAAQQANAAIAYWDESLGKFTNEPGPGRIPYLGSSELKDPKKEVDAEKQQKAILDDQRKLDQADMLAKDKWIRENPDIPEEKDPENPGVKTKAELYRENRAAYDGKWGQGGSGYGTPTPAASPPPTAPPAFGSGAPTPNPASTTPIPTPSTPPPLNQGELSLKPSGEMAVNQSAAPTYVINTAKEYAEVPSGAAYIDRDGKMRRKR